MSNSTETISFEQFHEPKLKSGKYTIEVTQTLNGIQGGPTTPFSHTKSIFVAGERFSIPASQVYACFPPQGNRGDHSNDLPSIFLNRSTLPWERYADGNNVELPWLFLFVYDDDDVQNGSVKVSSQHVTDVVNYLPKSTSPITASKINLVQEHGEVTGTDPVKYDPETVNVVAINKSWASQYGVMPTTTDLGLMTGVRVNQDATDPKKNGEMAICVANRLPKPGVKSYAHLLSLEGRVDTSGINMTAQGYDGTFTSFISLTSWSFTCAPETKETFSGLLNGLNQNNFAMPVLPSSVTGHQLANNYLKMGAVALPHHLKEAGETISWYHGPLVGGNTSNDTAPTTLPVHRSDKLLLVDSDLKMLNTSYAAAWELGRMLTLNNKSMAMDMYAWKRQVAWAQKQKTGDDTFHNLLPAGKQAARKKSMQDQADKIKTWLHSLNLLENIPFNYLVPDEALLPAESIRFFTLDDFWISSLLDGACSIGRVSESELKSDEAQKLVKLAKTGQVSGFLLRSQVVSGWPALEVEAPDSNTPGPTTQYLTKLRMELLGPDILLCLFEGEATNYDIHLKPEAIHFGFNRPSDPGTDPNGYTKDIRFSFNGDVPTLLTTQPSINIQWKTFTGANGANPYNEARIVDLDGLQNIIATTSGIITNGTMNSAKFAMEMVKGVPRVFFSKGDPKTMQEQAGSYEEAQLAEEMAQNEQSTGGLGSTEHPEGAGVPPSKAAPTPGGDHTDVLLGGDSGQAEKEKDFIEKLEEGAAAGIKEIEEKMAEHAQNPAFIGEGAEPPAHQADASKTSDIEKVIERLESEFPKASADLKNYLKHKKEEEQGLDPKEKGTLKYDIKKGIGEIKDLEPEVTDEVKAKLDEIKEKIEASPLLNMASARVRKGWVIATLILLVVSTILWTVSTIVDRERPQPLVFHFEGVKEMQEIEFVKQDYEELVPIATKDGQLEFLLTVPATVSGKMDMTLMEYEVEGDSVIKVTLPNPIISDPVLNLAKVKDYYDRGGGDKLFLSGGGASYSKAYEQIISAMEDTKKGILANAVKDDIIDRTNKEARSYLINMAGVTGYRIEFILKEPDPTWEDDMKKRLGKTYKKVKSKVEGHTGILKRLKDDLSKKKSDDAKTENK